MSFLNKTKHFIKNLNTTKVLKFLKFTSLIQDSIPTKEDTKVSSLVKVLSIFHSGQEVFKNRVSLLDSFIEKYKLKQLDSELIVEFLARSQFFKTLECVTHTVDDRTKIFEYKVTDSDVCIITEYKTNSSTSEFGTTLFYSNTLLLDSILNIIWSEYPNGIILEEFIKEYRYVLDFTALSTPSLHLTNKAQDRIDLYATKLRKGCYLALGLPGIGKSAFAIAVAMKRKSKLLKLDASLLSSLTIEHAAILFKVLKPSLIIIDDFDRINFYKNSAKILYLLEFMNSSSDAVIYLTANNLDSIDSAFLRSGRVDEIIDFESPDKTEREWLLINSPNPIDINIYKSLVHDTDGFSHADLINFKLIAAERPVEQALSAVLRLRSAIGLKVTNKSNKPRATKNNRGVSSDELIGQRVMAEDRVE